MSTRAYIAYINKEDNKIHVVYNHFDGYLKGLGDKLYRKYNSYDLIKDLVEKGDMSSPGDHYADKGGNFENVKPHIFDKSEIDTIIGWGEYIYLFEEDEYKYYSQSTSEWTSLKSEFIEDDTVIDEPIEMNLTNYVLVFKDSENNKVLCKNDGTAVDISDKPFYKTKENAEKGIIKILNKLPIVLEQRKYWHDKAIKENTTDIYQLKLKKEYLDTLLIIENGLEIVPVNISINW